MFRLEDMVPEFHCSSMKRQAGGCLALFNMTPCKTEQVHRTNGIAIQVLKSILPTQKL
jgi:hypothetical protein